MKKCPQCPYYEQKTSYGTEILECKNIDCPFLIRVESEVKNDTRRSNINTKKR